MLSVRAYICSVPALGFEREILAASSSKARYRYWLDLRDAWETIPLTAITVRSGGKPATPEPFLDLARRRGVPFARIGMRVEVDGRPGVIVGSSSHSANFEVLFTEGEHAGCYATCHPAWRMKYYDADGQEIRSAT